MRIPSDSELIAMWERASSERPVDRALTLLSTFSDEAREKLATVSIGRRDERLIEVHQSFFGEKLEAFAECPKCAEALEYTLSTHDLTSSPSNEEDAVIFSFKTGQTEGRLRLPDSLDLRSASECAGLEEATRLLTERCLIEARINETPTSIEMLPDDVIDAIASTLAAANPQAEMLIDLTCAACSHHWQVTFDIEPFLWAKLSAIVKRLLHQVHTLALAYGWREFDILNIAPSRRQMYMEMVAS